MLKHLDFFPEVNIARLLVDKNMVGYLWISEDLNLERNVKQNRPLC